LAWLNSRFARLLIDTMSAGADEDQSDLSRSYEVGRIRSLPDPISGRAELAEALARNACLAASTLADADEGDETKRRFVAPAIVCVEGVTITARVAAAYRRHLETAIAVITSHDDIDRALSRALDPAGDAAPALYDADGPLVTDLLSGTPVDTELPTRPTREVVKLATDRLGVARWIGLQHQVIDRRLELAAALEGIHPRALVDELPAYALPDGEPGASAHDLLSYLVGAAFGRWDIRIGAEPTTASPRPEPLAPVPLCPPGMLVGSDGYPAAIAPGGYPLRLPPDGLLLDEPGHSWDIIDAITRAAATLFDDADTTVDELTRLLGGTDLRTVVRRRFFRHHRTRYSKSKRTAPLYWPFAVPSRRWGVWLYAPVFQRETLYAVVGAAAARLARAESEILRLQSERNAGGAGRTTREVMAALTAEQGLAQELTSFRKEADRIANSGWVPDLNDGFALTASPLAALMPDWPELATTLHELKSGAMAWSTIHVWREQL
jgi:hypothetical protein